jgi:hypothetical protein
MKVDLEADLDVDDRRLRTPVDSAHIQIAGINIWLRQS